MRPSSKPKKSLGQNFLKDLRIQQKIVDAACFSPDDIVIEIGPGRGAITRLIAPLVKQLICVETDQDLIEPLQEEFADSNVQIVHADFLKWDMSALPQGIKVIGNIPYYISTPIIEKLIEERSRIASAYLTVQLEFGVRLAAHSGNKDYGSLSCFVQYHAHTQILFKIKSTAFVPIPKVDSCFIALDFTKPFSIKSKNEDRLFRLIRTSFTQRRKNILNAAASLVDKEHLMVILNNLNIPAKSRPEELNLKNFIDISDPLV